jgi:hypothetical protein
VRQAHGNARAGASVERVRIDRRRGAIASIGCSVRQWSWKLGNESLGRDFDGYSPGWAWSAIPVTGVPRPTPPSAARPVAAQQVASSPRGAPPGIAGRGGAPPGAPGPGATLQATAQQVANAPAARVRSPAEPPAAGPWSARPHLHAAPAARAGATPIGGGVGGHRRRKHQSESHDARSLRTHPPQSRHHITMISGRWRMGSSSSSIIHRGPAIVCVR